MRHQRLLLSTLSIAILLTLGGWGKNKTKKADLDTWHDRAQSFAELKTFDWQPADRLLSKSQSALDRWIVESAERELSEHGMRHSDAAEVDFVIAYEYTSPERGQRGQRANRAPTGGCRRGRCQRANPKSPTVKLDNSLYFEFQDPVTRLPFWRGRIRPVLGRANDLEGDFVSAVTEIFRHYPPPSS